MMKISQGLFDNMVLQRNRQNLAQVRFQGKSECDGILFARVEKTRLFKAGICRNGIIKGSLQGLKTGGPYEIELFVKAPLGKLLDKAIIRNVLVGDVWILAGQSNMEGIGYLKYALKPHPLVRAFYMDDQWGLAKDPIHNISKAVDQVHSDLAGGHPPVRASHVGVGPGVAFGQEMFRRTGVPQGLIACAHGGTEMKQWSPALKSRGERSLYGAMLRRFRKNGGKIAGIVWYQGCSDATEENFRHYTRRMRLLCRAMRKDFSAPRLPVAMVQIAGVYSTSFNPHYWNSIQEQQRLLPGKIRNLAVVPAIDLSMDDSIHISGFDQVRLGKRLAQAMCVLRGDRKAGRPPLEVQSITDRVEKKTGQRAIRVKFRNVMGHLQAAGKPSGFYITEDNNVNPSLFRTDLSKDTASLRFNASALTQLAIHYGHGLAPYCNITDSADRSLPVFGCLLSGPQNAFGKFIVNWLVSRGMPSAGKLNGLAYPEDKAPLQLKPRSFGEGHFCDLHLDIFACQPDDVLVYFAVQVNCRETMSLDLRLGYDGPVKIWIDGREMFHDPDGINPAVPDKMVIPWKAAQGNHEMLVALGSNHGKAWGIFARFSRRDIPRRFLKLGPAYYSLPVCDA